MKELKVPQFCDEMAPWGVIRFVDADGKVHEFGSCINRLSGNRLSWFDKAAPSINDPIPWVKSVFRDIRNKAYVLEYIGSRHFARKVTGTSKILQERCSRVHEVSSDGFVLQHD